MFLIPIPVLFRYQIFIIPLSVFFPVRNVSDTDTNTFPVQDIFDNDTGPFSVPNYSKDVCINGCNVAVLQLDQCNEIGMEMRETIDKKLTS